MAITCIANMTDWAINRTKAGTFGLRMTGLEFRNKRRNSLSEDPAAVFGFLQLWRKPRKWSNQHCSALFQLPAELRLRIYELMLCGELMLHIVPDFEECRFRLRGCRLDHEQRDDGMPEEGNEEATWPSLHQLCLDRARIMEDYEYGRNPEVGEKPHVPLLSLLLTCQRMWVLANRFLFS